MFHQAILWTFNDSVPGPTIRATEGDLVRIHFTNEGSKPHSLHFHGIHKAEMDGVFESIGTGGKFTYEFYAEPVGLHLYHCHVHPVEEHIAHGLYGACLVWCFKEKFLENNCLESSCQQIFNFQV